MPPRYLHLIAYYQMKTKSNPAWNNEIKIITNHVPFPLYS